MPYVDDETYRELMSFKEKTEKNERRLKMVERMYQRLNCQFQDIIRRYGSLPNPLISRQVISELQTLGIQKLESIYGLGHTTKSQQNEMWSAFRVHFGIKRITQLPVSQIPDAIKFLQYWVPAQRMAQR